MPLTKQELTILHLLAKGKAPSEITAELNISRNTLNSHRQSINRKLKGTGVRLDMLKGISPDLLEAMVKEKEEEKRKRD